MIEGVTTLAEKNAQAPIYPIMIAIAFGHLINDTVQNIAPAMFPYLSRDLGFTFTQLGLITFILNMVSSTLQPIVGFISDKKPMPYALPIGMISVFIGLCMFAFAGQYYIILIAAIFLGFGSAIFHPEGSRVSFMSAGNKRGLSQSIYQVGGNSGQAIAPLIGAFILDALGQRGAAVLLLLVAIGILLLFNISKWYARQLRAEKLNKKKKKILVSSLPPLTKKQVGIALLLLFTIIFARSFYTTNIQNYYVFYLIDHYHLTTRIGQIFIFIFMAFGVVGTFFWGIPFRSHRPKKCDSTFSGRADSFMFAASVHAPLACSRFSHCHRHADYDQLLCYGRLCTRTRSIENRNNGGADNRIRLWNGRNRFCCDWLAS